MNKLYTTLLIACLAAGFTACNDDDCEDLHLGNLAHYPNVLKGTFPTESQVLELGETLEITPELLNPEGATYSWLVNGKEYSTEPTFSYKIDNPFLWHPYTPDLYQLEVCLPASVIFIKITSCNF